LTAANDWPANKFERLQAFTFLLLAGVKLPTFCMFIHRLLAIPLFLPIKNQGSITLTFNIVIATIIKGIG